MVSSHKSQVKIGLDSKSSSCSTFSALTLILSHASPKGQIVSFIEHFAAVQHIRCVVNREASPQDEVHNKGKYQTCFDLIV